MAEIDSYKGWIDFIKSIMTILFGLLIFIFWNLDIVKNMDLTMRIIVVSVTILSGAFIILGIRSWVKILKDLKDA